MRYQVLTWHGEHRTVYHVVDPAAPEEPEVIISTTDRAHAEDAAACFNMAGVVIHGGSTQ